MESSYENIDARILGRLKLLGLKQTDLCRECGLSTTAVSQYCTGKRVPDTAALHKIATALGTSMEWLLIGENKAIEESIRADLVLSDFEADVIDMLRLLPNEHQQELFEIIELKYRRLLEKGMVSTSSTYTSIKETKIDDHAGELGTRKIV